MNWIDASNMFVKYDPEQVHDQRKNTNTHQIGLAWSKPKRWRLLDQEFEDLKISLRILLVFTILQCQINSIDVAFVLDVLD